MTPEATFLFLYQAQLERARDLIPSSEDLFQLVQLVAEREGPRETVLQLLIFAAKGEPRLRVALDELAGIVVQGFQFERQDNDLLESCLGAGGQLLGLAGSDEDSREA